MPSLTVAVGIANVDVRPERAILGLETMRALKVVTGQPLLLSRSASEPLCLFFAWPSFKLEENVIQIGGSILKQHGLKKAAQVQIEGLSVENTPALSAVRLLPGKVDAEHTFDDHFLGYLTQILKEKKYVFTGEVIDVTYYGQPVSFSIVYPTTMAKEDVPVGMGIISDTTDISIVSSKVKPTTAAKATTGYGSIGGLEAEVQTVREMVEGSLRDPASFTRLGLRPPKGVLLYGPPGTGKTLIARAVAAETSAAVLTINGPEIIGKYYGETEDRLRTLFREAEEQAPSIIVIDEIDALCPKRGNAESSEQENRIVAMLLTLLDGIAETPTSVPGQDTPSFASVPSPVVVVATTNRPDALDDALRRPGRLDREVEVGIPTAPARRSILSILLRDVPNTLREVDIHDLADRAHGFVGADLSALCREAGVRAIRRLFPSTSSTDVKQDIDLSDVFIIKADIEAAFTDVRPSGMREIMIEVPKVLWSDIGGQEMVKQKLSESVEWAIKHPEAFRRMGIRPPKGILLYGPPGCSKTLMAKALATEMGVNFLAVKGPELFSKWVGESEKAVRELFRKARANAPSIIFFDEVDALTVKRGGDDGTSVADRVLSQFLSELDGVEALVNVTVVAATNRPDIIDTALMRPGRIDRILYIGPPDDPARREILSIQLARMPCGGDINLDSLVEKTDGCSGAEVVALCQDAALMAMEESLEAREICQRHFELSLAHLQRRITPEMIEFYRAFQMQSGVQSV